MKSNPEQGKADLPQLILDWSPELSIWQRDALRRLFVAGEITDQDLKELISLAKYEAGLPNEEAIKAVPLDQSHLPQAVVGGQRVVLESISQNMSVNAIQDGQVLKFANSGITVVYGDKTIGDRPQLFPARLLSCECLPLR